MFDAVNLLPEPEVQTKKQTAPENISNAKNGSIVIAANTK
jgi:hypothetical protein